MRGSLKDSTANLDDWRKRAERLRALARVTRNHQARTELLDLAKQWDGMVAQANLHARRRLALAGQP